MARISDTEFGIALKLAAGRCVAADEELFMSLDISDTEVSPRVREKIMRAARLDEWKFVRQLALKIVKTASLLVMSAVVLIFAAAMCIQPIRAAFLDAVRTWYEDYISIEFEEKEFTGEFQAMLPTYIPKDWYVFKEQINEVSVEYIIKNGDGRELGYTQHKSDTTLNILIDNTNCTEEIIALKNGEEAYLYKHDDNSYHIIWMDKYKFEIFTNGLELKQLMKIVNSIKPIE